MSSAFEETFYKELEERIRRMGKTSDQGKRQSRLYQILSRELRKIGHWKARPRYIPPKGKVPPAFEKKDK